jgi:hypothetical protein
MPTSSTRAVFRTDLPPSLCREIGRIVTRWAYLESYIQDTLRTLLGISDQEGLLVLREPKLTERLEIIADLAHLYGLKAEKTALQSMNAAINKTVEIRNLMAHGTWSYDEHHQMWAVTVTKGAWVDQKAPKTERKKKVNPEGLLTNVDAMRRTIRDIDALIAQATKLRASLMQQIAGWRAAPPSPSNNRLAHERARRSP